MLWNIIIIYVFVAESSGPPGVPVVWYVVGLLVRLVVLQETQLFDM